MKLSPKAARESADADQTDHPMAIMITRTKKAIAMTMPCQAVSPWRHHRFKSNPLLGLWAVAIRASENAAFRRFSIKEFFGGSPGSA
jgi:hypothetical protein